MMNMYICIYYFFTIQSTVGKLEKRLCELSIRIMCESKTICLPSDCCFSEPTQKKPAPYFGLEERQAPSLTHQTINCFHCVIAEKVYYFAINFSDDSVHLS